ncbi:hypothetical protein SY27_12975 [Flavobacterium sp. 316]|uniref:DUF6252 family protein n=1 Tax=Flavobacterium sp. 316 TaxID=1603293 RepID=UPI0005E2BA9C|nr:DUF6252 family protein [Flavobacterium sp. 316]KIX20790.1 hypothetical protein SY27_12975 [Flavobacterium sp. 316]
MKKIVTILMSVVLLTSCVNETQDNTPAFQAKLNDTHWKARETSVSMDGNGGLIIKAYRGAEELILKTSSTGIGTYILGTTNSANSASYSIGTANNVEEYETSVVSGPVFSTKKMNSGTGYVLDDSAQTTGGTGVGLVFKIKVNSNGSISSDSIKARGADYRSGDLVTVQGGNNNATFRVLNVQQSNGEVVIEKVENGTFTGKFKLNAVNSDGDVVTFSQGVFFKIPLN